MEQEKFRKVEELYHAVLKLPPDERDSFLEESCGGDLEIRREVESLLSYEKTFASVIDTPPESLAAEMFAGETIAESIAGKQINQYKIVSLLGKGGMGTVYLAFDSKLERNVAIKFLSEEFGGSDSRLSRFFQEAKSASALNHPNILTVHEIGEFEGKHFIVSEFIAGKTLKKHLTDERPTLVETLDLAAQIGSALAAAHARGIVHRDIKPDNIMVRRDRLVKILDFGLAKLSDAERTAEFNAEAATRIQEMTAAGMIIGTPQYMSPEQARGQKIDSRTDIFSFGVVLYEMISGKLPFSGVNEMDTISAILKDEAAPLAASVPNIPPALERIVGKALRKDRETRYQHIKDLLIDVNEVKKDIQPDTRLIHTTNPAHGLRTRHTTGSIVTERRFSLAHALGFLLAGVLAFAAIWWFFSKTNDAKQPENILKSQEVVNWTSSPGEIYSVGSFSPDGKMIAFTSTRGGGKNIWIKQTKSGESVQVTKDEFSHDQPVWSPDGEELAFYSTRGNRSGFWRIPKLGGAPKQIAAIDDGSSRLLFWSPNSVVYYESNNEIFAADVDSGATKQFTNLTAKGVKGQSFSLARDEKTAAFVTVAGETYTLSIAGVDGAAPKNLVSAAGEIKNTAWHPDNRRIFYSALTNGTFQIFMTDTNAAPPRQITFSEQDSFVLNVSADGAQILYGSAKEESDVWGFNLKESKEFIVASDLNSELWADAAPDGKTLAYQSVKNLSQGNKLFSGSILTKVFGSDAAPSEIVKNGYLPKWSPDGQTIAYISAATTNHQIETVSAAGNAKKSLTKSGIVPVSYSLLPYNRIQTSDFSWSPDSKTIAFVAANNGQSSIWLVNVENQAEVQLTQMSDAKLTLACPLWSPDGKKIAYTTKTNNPDGTPSYGAAVIDVETKKNDPVYEQNTFIRLLGWLPEKDELVVVSAKGQTVGLPPEVSLLSIKITSGEARQIAVLKDVYLYNIQLSPDKKSVAFAARRDGKDNLWMMSITGGAEKKLTANNDSRLYFSSLSWSPDGNSIYFGKQLRFSLLSMLTDFQ